MKRKFLRVLGVLLLVAGLILIGANVADYLRFTRAVARATGLTQDQLRAIGDCCKQVSEARSGRFDGQDIPPEFAPLNPREVVLDKWGSYASLYTLGQVHLQLNVMTSSDNQHIYFFTNSAGPQKTTVLWHRDEKLANELSPTNRILTLSQGTMHEHIEWIILRDGIQVIDRTNYRDIRLASLPLEVNERTLIEEAIRSIPTSSRGKVYRTDGFFDGIRLAISFTNDGKQGIDDIVVENTWIELIAPLLEAVSRSLPEEHSIGFKRVVTDDRLGKLPDPVVRTLREWETMYYGKPTTPWWCVWRSLINRNEPNS